jgi:putative peptide zinc metalloprotease protein
MIGYAFAIWVYRFFLFLGIALLVYHLVFKLLGLFLMAVEIGWFIVRPIASEFQVWAKRRRDLRWNLRSIVSMLVLLGAVAAFFVPWQGHVSAPGLLQAERQAILYALTPGRILSMPDGIGAGVAAGTPAFVLDSPDLNYRIAQAGRQIRLVQAQASAQAFDPEQSGQLPVTWQEMESAVADLEEMEAQRAQLTIRAPFAGRIAELPDHLAPGAWVAAREPLALMVAPETVIAEAYVSEADLNRLSLGAEARFIPEDGTPSLMLRLRTIDRLATRELRETELASPHGGAIAARVVSENKLVPEEAIYRVQLTPAEPVEQLHSRRGTVVIDGERLSGASRLWKIALGILIRESGW